MVHVPFIQTWLGSQISGALEKKLNTKVSLGRIDLGFLNRIIIDELEIYDQKSKMMIRTSRTAAKIDYYQLVKNGRICISSAQIFGFNGRFYKKDALSKPNYQFILDSLASKDKDKKSDIEISINSLIIRHGAIKYDRYDQPATPSRFNTGHIDIRDISAHFILPYYTNDSVAVSVKKLSLKESSGFDLKNMQLDLTFNKQRASINNLDIELSGSDIHISSLKAQYRYNGNKFDKYSLKYSGFISKSKITPSDIACFIPYVKQNINPLFINTSFHGDISLLDISSFNLHSDDKAVSLAATGRITKHVSGIRWYANIKRLDCNMPKVNDIIKNIPSIKFTLPAMLTRLGKINYEGHLSGSGSRLSAEGMLATDIGKSAIRLNKENRNINASIKANSISLDKLLADKRFGQMSATVNIMLTNNNNGSSGINIDGVFPRFDYNSYSYKNIKVKGIYADKTFDGALSLDDTNGNVNIKGRISTDASGQTSDITASIKNMNPAALRLTDKWKGAKFNFNIDAKVLRAKAEPSLFTGNINVNNFSMRSADNAYSLDKLSISAEKECIYMQSDFGKAEIAGQYKINTIIKSFTNLLHSKLPTLYGNYAKSDNKFDLSAEITESDWLNIFFNIPLKLSSPLKVRANVDDEHNLFTLRCRADRFSYDGSPYENAVISADTPNDTLTVEGRIRKVMNNGHKLELSAKAEAADDKLSTAISWNNHLKRPIIGSLIAETEFIRNDKGKPDVHIRMKPSEILVNDTVWHVQPANINYSAGNLMIDHFSIEHNKQHIKIYGMATKSLSDSITVDMQDVDVNYVLNLINFHSVEFKGYSTGKAYIKSVFYEPDLYADLKVNQFKFEDGRMGELYANVRWNKTDRQIDINAHADDRDGARTLINGYVSPSRNFIDLSIKAEDTNVEFLEGFCGSFMSNVEAKANGTVRVHGPLSSINLTGMLVTDGNIRIIPLNTTYTLENDTIRFMPDNIVFMADTIRDRNGNIGIVDGRLHHEHLTRLTYDLSIRTENLLCYDTKSYGNDTFYGTAYGTGNCTIRGGNGRIDIDINITPQKGSFIEYNAANPEAISDQQFITWHDKTPRADNPQSESMTAYNDSANTWKAEPADMPSDMHINFLVNMTPDATLRVLMDKTNNDYIALNGTGSIRATYFNKGSFDMFGTYLIDHGIYKLTIQNIIKKEFQFQNGGTIVFGGDPYNAALNLQALYTVNSVPLSDLQIGNSFSSNNVRVDCIMNISGTPQTPRVDFDLDLPTVNNDAEQMVRTVINGEEEMNQQVVYLLSVGRFYIQKNNNSTNQNEQQDQTSLAMQSLLSGTISQQINTLLGNLVKNNNWTFGANISTGDEGFNNAEYEGLLSGRLLNNRLIINGQFGYRDNANATTSFIGDFDINYLLLPNGNIALKVYNQTNDRYFTKSSLNTQGIGLIMKKDFNSFMELFGFKKKRKHNTIPTQK